MTARAYGSNAVAAAAAMAAVATTKANVRMLFFFSKIKLVRSARRARSWRAQP
jgi:hypothetical protein